MISPPRKPARTVLYDGGCGLCSRVVRTLRRLDRLGRIEFLDVTSQWKAIAERYPHLSQDACLTDIHIAGRDGGVRLGFEGYRSLAWVLPFLWPVLPLLYLPGVPAVGRRMYRYVADHRSSGGCAAQPADATGRSPIQPAPPPRR